MSAEDQYFEAGKMAGYQKGIAAERRAIVAWLREEAQRLCIEDDVIQDEATAVKGYARAIELGEHLRGEDE